MSNTGTTGTGMPHPRPMTDEEAEAAGYVTDREAEYPRFTAPGDEARVNVPQTDQDQSSPNKRAENLAKARAAKQAMREAAKAEAATA